MQIPIVKFLESLWRAYLVYWAIFFSVMAVLFLGIFLKAEKNSRYRGFRMLSHPDLLMVATTLLFAFETLRQVSYEKAHPASEHESKITLGILLVFGVGLGLYRLRELSPRLYAFVEMVTAVLLSWQFLDKLPSTLYPVQLLGLATSVYIYVRAFDNFQKGWGKAAQVMTLFPKLRPKTG